MLDPTLNKNTSIFERMKGKGDSPFFIVELSNNHNGEVNRAKKMIKFAADSGADAVKLQSWSKTSLSSKKAYENNPKLAAQNERVSLSKEQFKELKEYADHHHIMLTTSVFSEEETDMAVELGMKFLKFASLDLTNLPLLTYVAKKGLPLFLSVGMSSIAEIETAINTIYATGNKQLVLMHCISNYPTEDNDINLNMIKTLKETFQIPIGFSDHTIGHPACIAATTLGACAIEKHVKLMDGVACREKFFALPITEIKDLVDNCKRIPYMLEGKGLYISPAQLHQRKRMRRSVITKYPLQKGQTITKENITFKRPGTGISPDKLQFVLGRKLKKDIGEDEMILWEDLE
ncbi:N-acylneuraminate-9-phosphate synthase [archaeon]|jgi:sialic acid synthase SpsE|nr:N-acylneuraminate-9-phosphate synthase [archaeon]MBT6697581.1 N-acylneuraminate-9-phosphate synthase [archaeon]